MLRRSKNAYQNGTLSFFLSGLIINGNRQLQRVGRTGRKRAGFVHVLLAEGREELNFDKAKDIHKEVQKTILRGDQLELYADVERLLPEHIKPECLEKRMEIQEYIRDEGKRNRTEGGRSPTKGTKRKRNDDLSRNIPTGASTGFVRVAELVVKGAKPQKKIPVVKDLDVAGQDDDTDLELESGLVMPPPRRNKSVVDPKPTEHRTKLRKALTLDRYRSKKIKETTSRQFSNKRADDENDLEIERGVRRSPTNRTQSEVDSFPNDSLSIDAIVDPHDNGSKPGEDNHLQH
jgi:ATP-dependent DNA helicase MPH1